MYVRVCVFKNYFVVDRSPIKCNLNYRGISLYIRYNASLMSDFQVFSPVEGNIEKDEEEKILVNRITEIENEKAILTANLPSLRRTNSDDDLLSTDDGSLDDMDTNCTYGFYYVLPILLE